MHSWNSFAGRRQADRLGFALPYLRGCAQLRRGLVLAERSQIYFKDQREGPESVMGRRGRHLLTRQGDVSCDHLPKPEAHSRMITGASTTNVHGMSFQGAATTVERIIQSPSKAQNSRALRRQVLIADAAAYRVKSSVHGARRLLFQTWRLCGRCKGEGRLRVIKAGRSLGRP
jgi:hypothetical protein